MHATNFMKLDGEFLSTKYVDVYLHRNGLICTKRFHSLHNKDLLSVLGVFLPGIWAFSGRTLRQQEDLSEGWDACCLGRSMMPSRTAIPKNRKLAKSTCSSRWRSWSGYWRVCRRATLRCALACLAPLVMPNTRVHGATFTSLAVLPNWTSVLCDSFA